MTDIDDDLWDDLRRRLDGLEPGTAFVTPVSERPFRVEATFEDRIAVRFRDSGEERQLWREQFEVFLGRLDDGPIAIADLPPGVELYASVVTLLADYTADDEAISHTADETAANESPYLVPPAEARTRPERLHDDALLLADLLARLQGTDSSSLDVDSLDTDSVTDLYVLLSDVQHESDRLRRSAREPLLTRLGPGQELHGRYGTVRRTTRERRRRKDDETVLDALDEHGIPREWVLGVDADKLDVVLAVTDLTEEEVYDTDEQVYVQKTEVDETEKFSRLQGLADRIDELEGVDGDELHEELAELEAQIDEALSA